MEQGSCSYSQTPDRVLLTAVQEALTWAHTPPENVLSPHQMDADMSSLDHKKNLRSTEKLRELRFNGEDHMDADRICELDIELINLVNAYQDEATDDLDDDFVTMPSLENNEEFLMVNDNEEQSLMENTDASEVADTGVGTTPELMVVPTPIKNTRRPGKRKCIFDEATTLSNEKWRQILRDTSNLVCKKRKAPRTAIDLWRSHCIPALSKDFSMQLIPCVAKDRGYIPCGKKAENTEQTTQLAVEIIETNQSLLAKQPDAATPNTPAEADSLSTVSPGTPVQCPTSSRAFGNAEAGDSDGESAHNYEDIREEFSVHEEDSSCPTFMAETDANEADSIELENNKKGGLSSKTRSVARYLRQVIQNKKQQGLDTTLLPIVEHKTKRENALFFSELLVLSTRGLINVAQEKAYGDVLLQETPKLEATLSKCGDV